MVRATVVNGYYYVRNKNCQHLISNCTALSIVDPRVKLKVLNCYQEVMLIIM